MEPSIVIDLIEGVEVIGHGVEGGLEIFLTESQRFLVAIVGEEIITVIGIVVADAGGGGVCLPCDGTYAIE